ncbi:MAG: C39 family peptidase [Anaerolineales bacterium]|nr:C39 family peptidase [Anaerolineales bacterium]MCB8953556.1 C39 family peptidase [Ardenticatenales bacterium]
MKRRTLFAILVGGLVIAGIIAWQLPTILKAIPSRYVARLPEPIQALGVREHVSALPTVAVVQGAAELLAQPVGLPAPTETPLPPPPTLTPRPLAQSTATPLPPPSPTSIPPTPTITPTPLPAQARISPVYHQFQDWNNCGPATLAMALSYFNIGVSQYDVARVVKPDPEDRNVSPWELAAYAHDQPNLDARYRTNGTLDQLRAFIANGIPVIIELGLDPPGEYAWMEWYGHYLLVVAYDDARGQVWVYDSWLGTSAVPGENGDRQGRTIPYDVLQTYWRQFNNNYIALYRPEQAETVARIMGADMDDAVMWQRALTTVQSLLGADPQNPYLWFDLGTVYNALGEYERAATAFDQARNIGLPWRMLWYQFGPYEAYYQVGRYADVILLADVTLQDRPYFEEAFYYKALAQQALGQAEEARRNLQRAVAFNPNYQPAQVALAQMTDGN